MFDEEPSRVTRRICAGRRVRRRRRQHAGEVGGSARSVDQVPEHSVGPQRQHADRLDPERDRFRTGRRERGPRPHITKYRHSPSGPDHGQAAPALPNKTLFTFTLSSPILSGPYSLVQQVLDFAPGSQTPQHRHGGPGLITVLQGQVTLSRDGLVRTFNAGDSFVEMPGQTLQAFNRGSADLVLAATFLLPDGAQLTTNL